MDFFISVLITLVVWAYVVWDDYKNPSEDR